MSVFTCPNCATVVEVPQGHTRGKIRCGGCGTYPEIPKETRETPKRKSASTADEDAVAGRLLLDIPEPRPEPPLEDPEMLKPALLDDGLPDDEDSPYRLPEEDTKPCPACNRRIRKAAKLCTECGFDLVSGAKAKKTYQPIFREWDSGWPLKRRQMLFLAGVGLDVLASLGSLLRGGYTNAGMFGLLMIIALQAFLLGTFDRFTLRRNEKGKAKLTTSWYAFFYPMKPTPVEWTSMHGVRTVTKNEPGMSDWVMLLCLLPLFIVPAILWWWFVIRADRYDVHLCGPHGTIETCIHHSRDKERSQEIVALVSDATGLRDESAR